MRMNIHILNKSIETLKARKSRYHILGTKATGYVTDFNTSHYINILYSAKSMSRFTMVFNFYLMKIISCKWNFRHKFLLRSELRLERCDKISKFSILEPFVHHLHDVISMINTETKRIVGNTKIQLFKYTSLLNLNIKLFFKNFLVQERMPHY